MMQTTLATPRKTQISKVIWFFFLAYLISWSIWGLLLIFPDTMGEMYFLVIFGAFGPFAAAAILTRHEQGKEGAKAWRQKVFKLRGHIKWCLLAGLGLPFLIAIVHTTVYAFLYGLPNLQTEPPWYWLFPAIPVNVYIAVIYSSALGEEPGWQGYAMPHLLKQFTPIMACIILGILWAMWHLPLYFTPLWSGNESLLLMVLYTSPLAMILTWLTHKARGSVMPAVFLHQATNLYGDYLLETQIFQQPLVMNFTEIKTVLYWVIAIFLIWRTRGLLGYGETAVEDGHLP